MSAVDRIPEQSVKDFIAACGLSDRHGDVMRATIHARHVEVVMLRRGSAGGFILAGEDLAKETVEIGVVPDPKPVTS